MFDDVPFYVQEFLLYIKTIKNRSNATIREYHYDLRDAFRYLKKEKFHLDDDLEKIDVTDIDIDFIQEITLNDLYQYLGFLSMSRSDKPTTRARKIASLKSFFNYVCLKKKVLKVNPTIDLETPKLGKRIPKYLTLDESISLLHSIDGKYKDRDYAIITIFLNCGLRLSELVNINMNSIKDNTLQVIGKGNKERQIYLNDACTNAINKYICVRSKNNIKDQDALFLSERGTRIGRRTVEMLVKKYLKLAGLDYKKFSPHKLRHTAATLMHKYGNVDIRTLQQILGHESIATTEIYTHIDDEQVKEALKNNPLNNI